MFEKFGLSRRNEGKSVDSQLLAKREMVGKVIKVIAYKIEAPQELEEDEAILQFHEEKYAEVDRITEQAKKGNFEPAKEWMEKNNQYVDAPGKFAFETALGKVEKE